MPSWQQIMSNLGPYSGSVVLTNMFALIFGAVIVWACFASSTNLQDRIPNVLLAVFGALCGWALGIFFSPFSAQEHSLVFSAGQAISAFVSGYVLSKLDRFLEGHLFEKSTPTSWVRMAIFACSLLLVMVTVFSNRLYFRADASGQIERPAEKAEGQKT